MHLEQIANGPRRLHVSLRRQAVDVARYHFADDHAFLARLANVSSSFDLTDCTLLVQTVHLRHIADMSALGVMRQGYFVKDNCGEDDTESA